MIKEAIGSGKTVELATEDAKFQLGVAEDADVHIEVIALEKKPFLGIFGGSDAQVKAWIEVPDEKPARKNKAAKKTVSAPKQKREKAPKKENAVSIENAVDISKLDPASKAGKAAYYLKAILDKLGCENTEISVAQKENGALIILNGEGLGVVIGHRGETLDALQHLSSLAAGNGGGYFKVTLNIGNYRERREETLIALAKRTAAKALEANVGKSLEPMNPYERRIIHTAVQEIEGVESSSIGEGESRRVVIFPAGADLSSIRIDSPRRNKGNHRDFRGGRDRRGRGGRRPSNAVSSAPTRAPKSDADLPLYGKIK